MYHRLNGLTCCKTEFLVGNLRETQFFMKIIGCYPNGLYFESCQTIIYPVKQFDMW